jgi:levansucrase
VLIRLATGLMALAMMGGVAAPASADEAASSRTGTRQYSADDDYFAVWSRADALKLRQDRTNTAPRVSPDFPVMTDKVWVWDTWPLTRLTTRTATYKGWHVIFSLTAPRSVPFGDRHWYAKIGYFYSRDAKSWKYGGDLFKPGTSFGSREWAGSTALVGDKVYSFYTASGRDNGGVDPNDALQRLAQATGKIHADSKRVWFSGFKDHRIIAEADGKLYQTLQQSQAGPIIYAFRDPFVFRDPRDRRIHLLFEGNTGGVAGTYRCTKRDIGDVPAGHEVPEDAKYYTGNIGLATADSGSMNTWRLQPPLLSANCVNQQTERPHLVIRNGKYYLFTISHKSTFAPGPERLGRPLRVRRRLPAQRLQAAQRQRTGPGQPGGCPDAAVLALRDAQRAGGELHRHGPDRRRRNPLRRHPGTHARGVSEGQQDQTHQAVGLRLHSVTNRQPTSPP